MAFNCMNSVGKKAVKILNEAGIEFTVKDMKDINARPNYIQLNCNYGRWGTAPFAIIENERDEEKARLLLHQSGSGRFKDEKYNTAFM